MKKIEVVVLIKLPLPEELNPQIEAERLSVEEKMEKWVLKNRRTAKKQAATQRGDEVKVVSVRGLCSSVKRRKVPQEYPEAQGMERSVAKLFSRHWAAHYEVTLLRVVGSKPKRRLPTIQEIMFPRGRE